MEDFTDIVKDELKSFLNDDMQLTALPSKRKKLLVAIYYLASKIESGKTFTEKEINDILNSRTTFRDPATLRREMYNHYLLDRTNDCREYRKSDNIPDLSDFLAKYL